MPAYKNKENGSWYVVTQYTDWTGERKPKCKRGFATRREALEWEQKFQQQSAGDLDISSAVFLLENPVAISMVFHISPSRSTTVFAALEPISIPT